MQYVSNIFGIPVFSGIGDVWINNANWPTVVGYGQRNGVVQGVWENNLIGVGFHCGIGPTTGFGGLTVQADFTCQIFGWGQNLGSGASLQQPAMPQPVSEKICVLYDPRQRRIVHTHQLLVLPGGRDLTEDQIEKLAREKAAQSGQNVEVLRTLHVDEMDVDDATYYRVDEAGTKLVKLAPKTSAGVGPAAPERFTPLLRALRSDHPTDAPAHFFPSRKVSATPQP
jgi:hypothetical protein